MTEQDARMKAMGLLEGLCPQHTIHLVVVRGDPISKARPRFSKGGHPYTPTKTIEGEKRIAAMLYGMPRFASNVAVSCLFFRSCRQRIDVDNLMKAVLDAGTRAAIWHDDSQVTALIGIIEYDPDNPRTIICLGEHQSTLTRGDAAKVVCEACGKLFLPGGKRRGRARWCSRACQTYLSEPIPCPACGIPFKRRNSNHKYCNGACRGVAQTRKAIERRKDKTHCRRGHLLDASNVYLLPNGGIRCLRCQADRAQIYRDKLQAF